jgi:hypothetical protein
MTAQTDRSAMLREIAKKEVVYQLPGMEPGPRASGQTVVACLVIKLFLHPGPHPRAHLAPHELDAFHQRGMWQSAGAVFEIEA